MSARICGKWCELSGRERITAGAFRKATTRFIRRIQSDDPENLKFGDPDKYFDFTEDQKTFVGMILKEIHTKYGDIYEEVNARGYE